MSNKSQNGNEPQKGKVYARRLALFISVVAAILLLIGMTGYLSYKPGGLLLLIALLPVGVLAHDKLENYAFTAWVLMCAGLAMIYPQYFIEWGGFRLELLIVPLTQIIMFGMGTTLSVSDFVEIGKSPWPVFVGVLLQFGIMPLSGYFLAEMFGFSGEIAAGIVLIGSCSGGVASNLMVYLAGANVALSVTMTFASTMFAPLATPLLMSNLAGTFVPIDAIQMMFSIFNMIIVPVIAGLIAHEVLYSKSSWAQKGYSLTLLTLVSTGGAMLAILLGSAALGPLYSGILLGSILIAIVTLTKLVMSIWLNRPNTWMDKVLPLVSKVAICVIITIIIAQTYEVLIDVGLILLLAAIIHNAIGYFCGYWGAWGIGKILGKVGYQLGLTSSSESQIDEIECRTVAFEVGMQNGGMATGLAIDVLESKIAALPPNLFGTWMNISGSMLANYWMQRPAGDVVKGPRADVENTIKESEAVNTFRFKN